MAVVASACSLISIGAGASVRHRLLEYGGSAEITMAAGYVVTMYAGVILSPLMGCDGGERRK